MKHNFQLRKVAPTAILVFKKRDDHRRDTFRIADGGVNEAWTYASIVGHSVGGRFNPLICGNLSQVRGTIKTHKHKLHMFNGYTEQGVKILQCKSTFV
jgi:hypothetical protein